MAGYILFALSVFQWLYLQPVDAPKEQGGQDNGDDLRDRDGPPHHGKPEKPGEQVGNRKDDYKLSGNRYDQAVHAVSKRLEDGANDDAVACEQEAKADDPKRGHADGQHRSEEHTSELQSQR